MGDVYKPNSYLNSTHYNRLKKPKKYQGATK